MRIGTVLAQLLGDAGPTIVVECRQCGMTVTPEVETCPECDATLEEPSDVEFVEMDATTGFFAASKRFYLTACGHCGAAIGGGVAGAKA